jgi:hypothetical protein
VPDLLFLLTWKLTLDRISWQGLRSGMAERGAGGAILAGNICKTSLHPASKEKICLPIKHVRQRLLTYALPLFPAKMAPPAPRSAMPLRKPCQDTLLTEMNFLPSTKHILHRAIH